LKNSIDGTEEETLPDVGVDSRERVVEENDLGVVVDKSSDGDSLFLTGVGGKGKEKSATKLDTPERRRSRRLTLPTS